MAPALASGSEEEEGAAGRTAPVLDYAFFRVTLDASGHGDEAGDAAIAGGADDGGRRGQTELDDLFVGEHNGGQKARPT